MALRIIAILSAIVAIASDAGAAERRVALVIGNSSYVSSPLTNPANDANDVADILGRLGFQMIRKINVGLLAECAVCLQAERYRLLRCAAEREKEKDIGRI